MKFDQRRLSQIAATLSGHRDVDTILREVVSALTAGPEIALARIWLTQPGDLCSECGYRSSCADQRQCLHLVASDGQSLDASLARWRNLSGQFRRFPMNVDKIGRIVTTGEALNEPRIEQREQRFAHPEWARAESIYGFSGQPLIFAGKILGALCVFSRVVLSENDMAYLRIFANHAAAALANAEAFAEIARLQQSLQQENEYLRHEIRAVQGAHGIIGASRGIQRVLDQIDAIAPTDANVLILGESGTGKELVANAIHEGSTRKTKPMVRVNCASVPRDLFESEFFGHVAGAYTGAQKARVGRFKLADGGTLFLDEIAEIPLELQSKLLRVLQEGTFEPVGSDSTLHVNVRVIAATNRNLLRHVREGRFREDLYYRLSVLPIEVPPLRDRAEDIEPLASLFIEATSRRLGTKLRTLTRDQIAILRSYSWPGNVRELQNAIERAVILSRGGPLKLQLAQEAIATPAAGPTQNFSGAAQSYAELEVIERALLEETLVHTRGKIAGPNGAAEKLGVKPTTLLYRIRKCGIDPRQYRSQS